MSELRVGLRKLASIHLLFVQFTLTSNLAPGFQRRTNSLKIWFLCLRICNNSALGNIEHVRFSRHGTTLV